MEHKNVYLLDIYSNPEGITLWFLSEKGEKFKIKKSFSPYFFLLKTKESKKIVKHLYDAFKNNIKITIEIKEDLINGELEVFKIVSKNPLIHNKLILFLKSTPLIEEGIFYNLQLTPEQLFMFEKDIFPFFKFKVIGNKWIRNDNVSKINYEIPYLKKIYLKFEIDRENPKYIKTLPPISVKIEGENEIIVDNDVEYINNLIEKFDPDIVITEYGDSIILPKLLENNVRSLNIDKISYRSKGVSFESYGKVYYRDPSVYLRGRIHIDKKNSFFYNEVGFEGIIELSRISSLPVQKLARSAIGTPITSMEMKKAFQQGYLIPYRKSISEDTKTAKELMKIDKGGLTYRPIKGIHENVAELDFFSMYPSIILNYNLSYETINCKHSECKTRLPYVNYRVCTKKLGIVPQVLRFLLLRRKKLKQLKEEKRQIALKWLLVVSFGYLGYKNAIFGRIESHEATTAIGRMMLLSAKEVAEREGYKFLHGLTDSIWVYKENVNQLDYKNLEEKINKVINKKFKGIAKENIGFKINLEGIYDWIVFLSSKLDDISVPNRYYGKFKNGELKIRGIEIRRHDTPDFIKDYQEEVLNILRTAKNKKELLDKRQLIDQITEKYRNMLENGDIKIEKLVVVKRNSKEVFEYQKRTDISETVGTLVKEGIKVNPGEKINIIYVKEYKGMPYEIYIKYPKFIDTEKYIKMLFESKKAFNFENLE
ncbi:DNA polymerase domain-containing protein [Sulfurihydrogenibium subterraneum]|uniref:DNA polymerase domain-containing protein n=1 Tax=Sulfurihydrogenibium subterraneum TaxID=171121 RepID=UPI00049036B7|nr:DNA polymerase domain-containing protein [Sulfurihydrogenibium subterraneum]